MDGEKKRARGTGGIVRNTRGEPVGVRVRDANGEREIIWFRPSHAGVSEQEAQERAPRLVALAKRAVSTSTGITCAEWWTAYHDAAERGLVGRKRGRKQAAVADRRRIYRLHIDPVIGTKGMAAVTSDDLRKIVDALDALVMLRSSFYADEGDRVSGKGRGSTKPGMAPKTAGNVWGEITAAFAEARKSPIAALRVRDDNPTETVRGPIDGEDDRKQAALFPVELDALLSCERIPLWRRRAYACAAYSGLRQGELRGLCAVDIDFQHSLIVVRRQMRKTEMETRTKTPGSKRMVPIEPALLPLLKLLVQEAGSGPLLRIPRRDKCADVLRDDLRRAGLTREELFLDDAEHQHFTFHGMRHSALTHWAVAGRPMQWIQAAAGHTEWETTQKYLDAALMLRAGFGTPHAPLPASLLTRDEFGQSLARTAMMASKTSSNLWGGRDSKSASDPKKPVESGQPLANAPADPRQEPLSAIGQNPRAAALANLYRHAAELAASGDIAGARALHTTIATLLGEGSSGADVIDLAATRRSRR